jgi:hypothetical protein
MKKKSIFYLIVFLSFFLIVSKPDIMGQKPFKNKVKNKFFRSSYCLLYFNDTTVHRIFNHINKYETYGKYKFISPDTIMLLDYYNTEKRIPIMVQEQKLNTDSLEFIIINKNKFPFQYHAQMHLFDNQFDLFDKNYLLNDISFKLKDTVRLKIPKKQLESFTIEFYFYGIEKKTDNYTIKDTNNNSFTIILDLPYNYSYFYQFNNEKYVIKGNKIYINDIKPSYIRIKKKKAMKFLKENHFLIDLIYSY